MANKSKLILGASGEYYVAAYLSGMGLIVAITRGGTPTTDLIATTEAGGRAVTIQVKTGANPYVKYQRLRRWDTPSSAAAKSDSSHWYAFVAKNGWPIDGIPDLFFVPSTVVSADIQRQVKQGDTRLMFELLDADADQYRGRAGFDRLHKFLTQEE